MNKVTFKSAKPFLQIINAGFAAFLVISLTLVERVCADAGDLETIASYKPDQGLSGIWGDIDNDGDLDLLKRSPYLKLFKNNGGILDFEDYWTPAKDSTAVIATLFIDVNEDGFLDVLSNSNGLFRLFLNNASRFSSVPDWLSADSIHVWRLTAGDIDNDHDQDLVVSSLDTNLILVYEQTNDDLLFRPIWSTEVDTYRNVQDIVLADIDGNGFLDLLVGNSVDADKIFFNIDGVFEDSASWESEPFFHPVTLNQLPNNTVDIEVGDVDNDGDLDVVCGKDSRPPDTLVTTVIYTNDNGLLSTMPSWKSGVTGGFGGISLGDFDGDGDLDLAASGGPDVYVNFGHIQGTPSWRAADVPSGKIETWIDIDCDGNLDLVTTSGVYRSNPSLLTRVPSWKSNQELTQAVAFGDVDNDSYDDLALTGIRYYKIAVIKNNSGKLDEGVLQWVYDDSRRLFYDVKWADYDNDGDLDLSAAGDKETVIFNNTHGWPSFAPVWESDDSSLTNKIAWGDYNRDGYLDLACVGDSLLIYTNMNGTLPTNADLKIKIPRMLIREATGRDLAWADLDRDGDLDLAVITTITSMSRIVVFFNNNGNMSAAPGFSWSANSLNCLNINDFNGDDFQDLFVGTGNPEVNGDEDALFFSDLGELPDWPSWFSNERLFTLDAKSADLDLNHYPDLILAVGGSRVGAYYTDSAGVQINQIRYTVNDVGYKQLQTLDLSDYDRDGDVDIALANSGGSSSYSYVLDNNRIVPRSDQAKLVNNPAFVTNFKVLATSSDRVTFNTVVVDAESDRVNLYFEYSDKMGGNWKKPSILEDAFNLESSPEGVTYTFTWDFEADNADGYDIWMRVAARSHADRAGISQYAEQVGAYRIGRLDSKPVLSIAYPKLSTVADSLALLGSVRDATNLKEYVVELAPLPDTSNWLTIFETDITAPQKDTIATIDISGLQPGEYVIRHSALDFQGNRAIYDDVLHIRNRTPESPRVVHVYPPAGQKHVPLNSPVVVQFDRDINQPSIDYQSALVFSENGAVYQNPLYDYSSRTLTIQQSTPFKSKAFHHVVVDHRILSVDGTEMAGQYASGFRTADTILVNAVDSIGPRNATTSVPVTLDSLVVFSSGEILYKYLMLSTLEGEIVLFDTLESSPRATVALPILQASTYYLIRLSNDPAGAGDSDYMSYFITEDTQLPLVVDFTPSDKSWLVALDSPVRVEFNKPMNTFSINESSFHLTGPYGNVPGVIEFGGDDGTAVTFYANDPLDAGSEYTAVLTDHIKDNIGNPIDPLSWTFTTGVFGEVSYEGSVISSPGIELAFPLGAIAAGFEVGLGQLPSDAVPQQDGLTFTGLAYEITPAEELAREAILAVVLPDSILDENTTRFSFFYFDPLLDRWEFVGGSKSGNVLKASIDKLGVYGVFESEAGEIAEAGLAASLSLLPRVINPRTGGVNGQLNISFRVAEATGVHARIYDTSGRLVKTLSTGSIAQVGENLLNWDGRADSGEYAPDGLHVLVLEADGQKAQKTFVILNR